MAVDSKKNQRILSLLSQMAAAFLEKELVGSFMITVTGASLSDDRKFATIFFTVFPDNKEEEALALIKRERSEFRRFVETDSRLGKIPFFDFKIDLGEKNRQKIDYLSHQK